MWFVAHEFTNLSKIAIRLEVDINFLYELLTEHCQLLKFDGMLSVIYDVFVAH